MDRWINCEQKYPSGCKIKNFVSRRFYRPAALIISSSHQPAAAAQKKKTKNDQQINDDISLRSPLSTEIIIDEEQSRMDL